MSENENGDDEVVMISNSKDSDVADNNAEDEPQPAPSGYSADDIIMMQEKRLVETRNNISSIAGVSDEDTQVC